MSLEILKTVLQQNTTPSDENLSKDISNGDASAVRDLDNLSLYLRDSDHHPILENIRSNSTNELFTTKLSEEELHYLRNSFEDNKADINRYNETLKPIGAVLGDLNRKLTELSSNLISLHEQSQDLSKNLNQQILATEKLTPVIIDLLIPPGISLSIIKGPINAQWIENLRFINEKIQFIENIRNETLDPEVIELYKDSPNLELLEQDIQKLTSKAIETIRDHFIKQIKLLRSSTSQSSQLIQQELLRIKEAFVFLQSRPSELAKQLQLAYFYTMRWYYKSKFAKYLYALQKLHLHHLDATFVLSGSTPEEKTYFNLKSWIPTSSTNNGEPQNPLTFGEYLGSIDKRMEILTGLDLPRAHKSSMPAQIAETTPFAYWIEFVFSQWFTALIDNVVVEYLFVIEFFYQNDERIHTIDIDPRIFLNQENNDDKIITKQWFLLIFEDVYRIGREFLNWLITRQPYNFSNRAVSGSYTSRLILNSLTFTGTCDAYGILLIIRIIQLWQRQLNNQFHIPVLEDHFNSLYLDLWPQFTKIIDLNCESMKKVIIRLNGSQKNLAPTLLTQQFGQFLLGLLKLSNTHKDVNGEPIVSSITRLRNDFENILTKLTSQFKNQSHKEIFLYNNYFLVLNILKNENNPNELVNEQIQHFDGLCNAYKSLQVY